MADVPEPTVDDVEALVCAATPQFAYQIRARVRDLVRDLPEGDPVRVYGEQQAAMLDRLGTSSSRAAEGPIESPDRIGWEFIKSHRPVHAE
jgi:hypothetical protein